MFYENLIILNISTLNGGAGQCVRHASPPPAPSYDQYEADLASAGSNAYAKGPKGRVGPVYTFVKTDPKANFKWGVRHVAGVQYGK